MSRVVGVLGDPSANIVAVCEVARIIIGKGNGAATRVTDAGDMVTAIRECESAACRVRDSGEHAIDVAERGHIPVLVCLREEQPWCRRRRRCEREMLLIPTCKRERSIGVGNERGKDVAGRLIASWNGTKGDDTTPFFSHADASGRIRGESHGVVHAPPIPQRAVLCGSTRVVGADDLQWDAPARNAQIRKCMPKITGRAIDGEVPRLAIAGQQTLTLGPKQLRHAEC